MSSKINLEKIVFCPLSPELNVSEFSCANKELTEFLIDGTAFEYQKNHLAQTTCLLNEGKIVGYYSIMADALKLSGREKEKMFKENKRIRSYPALKIARLATDERYQGNGIGSLMVTVVKGFAVWLNENGVSIRFITVDSKKEVPEWYKQRGFIINQSEEEQKKRETISMRFDLYASVE